MQKNFTLQGYEPQTVKGIAALSRTSSQEGVLTYRKPGVLSWIIQAVLDLQEGAWHKGKVPDGTPSGC